jgi:hypothetical protein
MKKDLLRAAAPTDQSGDTILRAQRTRAMPKHEFSVSGAPRGSRTRGCLIKSGDQMKKVKYKQCCIALLQQSFGTIAPQITLLESDIRTVSSTPGTLLRSGDYVVRNPVWVTRKRGKSSAPGDARISVTAGFR